MNKKIKNLSLCALTLLIVAGTYNSVMINAESDIPASAHLIKRLDEMNGVVKEGRATASVKWEKIDKVQPKNQEVVSSPVVAVKEELTTSEEAPLASIQEELDLRLTEVSNSNWPKDVSGFSGNLVTKEGIIESLSVSLPGHETISVSFSELSGNVFQYDYEGELLSGVLFQVDEHHYMVSLSNGPFEGTNLRFAKENAPAPMEVGTFGSSAEPAVAVDSSEEEIVVDLQAQGFNFGSENI